MRVPPTPDPDSSLPDSPVTGVPLKSGTTVQYREPTWGLGEVWMGLGAAQFIGMFGVLAIASVFGWTLTSSNGTTTMSQVPMWGQALMQLPTWISYLGVPFLAAKYLGNGWVEDFKIRMKSIDIVTGLIWGVAAQLVIVPVFYWPIYYFTNIDTDAVSEPARQLADRADDVFGWIVFALIVGVGAPIVEEIFFRGLLQRSLMKKQLPTWAIVTITSVIFGAIHLQPVQFVGLTIFGVILSVLTLRADRLGPALWAHVAFNLTTVVQLALLR